MNYLTKAELEKLEVEACPFCGKANKLSITPKDSYCMSLADSGSACISITCWNCDCDLYEHSDNIKRYELKVTKLIKKWNTRNNNG